MKNLRRNLIFLLAFVALASCAQDRTALNAPAFSQKIKADKNAVVVDVRTAPEFSSDHLAKAINLDVKAGDFSQRCDKLDKTKTYYVYCLAGVRSERAADMMRSKGFKVVTLSGGINAWKDSGLPVVK